MAAALTAHGIMDPMVDGGHTIRDATAQDAAACRAIYAPYVEGTSVTFEVEVPTEAEMAARITSAVDSHAWLVLSDAGRVVGFAYGHQLRERAAYQWAAETTIYLELGRRRTGGGRALYEALLARLAARGYHRAFAGMIGGNGASAGLHRALGFEPIGVYREVGWKHDAWHDVEWMQKALAPAGQPPTELR